MVPPLCPGNIQFWDLETFALLFVENTVQDAINLIVTRNQSKNIPHEEACDLVDKELFKEVTPTDRLDQLIDESLIYAISTPHLVTIHNENLNEWPNIGFFRKVDIIDYIKKFVNKWELKCNWKYCIDFLCEERNKASDTYFYEVKWSIPTKEYPIPQVTASVYFRIEVSRCKPKCSPINVSYMYEGSGLVHKPYKIHFNEEWLLSILENKIRFISTLKF